MKDEKVDDGRKRAMADETGRWRIKTMPDETGHVCREVAAGALYPYTLNPNPPARACREAACASLKFSRQLPDVRLDVLALAFLIEY